MKRVISFLAILLADVVSLILAFYAAYFLRIKIVQTLFNVSNPWFFPIEHFYSMYYLLFVFILIFYYEKLYSRRYDFIEECLYIARGLFISVILIAVIVYLSRSFESFTRTLPILMMFTGMIIVPVVRLGVKKILKLSGVYIKNVALVGLKDENERVIPILEKMKRSGHRFTRVLNLEPTIENERGTGLTEEERGFVEDIDVLLIVSRGLDNNRLNGLINFWESHVKEIKIVSDLGFLKTIGVRTEYLEELLVMRMENKLISPLARFFKRLFDLLVSIPAIIIFLPFFLIIAILIKLNSPGPVFFVQERFGRSGKRFNMLKFRTMSIRGDAQLDEYLKKYPERRKEWDTFKKLKSHDPRVTGVGKFLRRFSIDEFPQIFNVLIGDMSIVGPRPYMVREKEEIEKSAAIIFRVKSGLTGLWQIKGRNDLDFSARLKLDEFYVRNWSFLLDITIILKTFGVVLKGKGAY